MNLKDLRMLLLRRFNIPQTRPLERSLERLAIAEKTVFFCLVAIFIFSAFGLVIQVNALYLNEVPITGGTLTEGIVGNPRFANPVLALSDADKNLVSLVYSGLVKNTPDGKVVNDLAEDVTVSSNHLVYTATLREDALFQDGTAVTADDVIFTIQKVSDPLIKSPKRGNWDGVTVEKVDDHTVNFTLKTPYTPFLENLTLGILPKHIWKNVTSDEFAFSQFNTLPIGTGPFRVEKVERNSGGIPDYYKLVPFSQVVGKKPYLGSLVLKFYPSEEALLAAYQGGDISSFGGISPDKVKENLENSSEVISSPLPRVFAAFFNQSHSKALAQKEVREALSLITPRQDIVDQVLLGYGTPIEGPLPAGIYSWTAAPVLAKTEDPSVEAAELLANAGWKKNSIGILEKKIGSDIVPLSFSLSTGDAPELKAVANELREAWENLGAEVKLEVSETGDLNQNVIRPRNFDALLFGEVVSRDADLYPFWHSSQRSDPGLNIAQYANSQADKLLNQARGAVDEETREENYKDFTQEIDKDIPAVFLYSPSFLYVLPEDLKNVKLGPLASAQERFLGVRDWYLETDKVWKIFTQ